MNKGGWILIPVFLLVATLPLLSADSGRGKAEFFFTLSMGFPSINETYAHANIIDFPSGPDSTASQQILLRGCSSLGWNGGLFVPLSPRFSLKLSVDINHTPIRGENTSYNVHLDYITRFPPDYLPVHIVRDSSIIWPETDGKLRMFSLYLSLRYRITASKRFELAVSAGPVWSRIGGGFRPLGYSEYWLGGHGVLFSENYLLRVKLPTTSRIGGCADLELILRLSKKVSFVARAAGFSFGRVSWGPVIDEILNYSLDPVREEKMREIRSSLNVGPLKINPSTLSLQVGFRLVLPYL